MASEQIERILQAYLILVEHANGSKISLPEDVCQVGQTITLADMPEKYQLNIEEVWSAEVLVHTSDTSAGLGFLLSEQRRLSWVLLALRVRTYICTVMLV